MEVERRAHPLLAAELWQRGTEERVAAEGPRRVKEGLFYYVFYDRKGKEKSILGGEACCAACGILVPQPGMEPMPPTVEAWSLNHWTAREFPKEHVYKLME